MINLSRKDFIKAAAITTTAAVLPVYAVAAEKREDENGFHLNPNPLKLGLMTYNIGKD